MFHLCNNLTAHAIVASIVFAIGGGGENSYLLSAWFVSSGTFGGGCCCSLDTLSS